MKITFDPQVDSLALIQAIFTAFDMSRATANAPSKVTMVTTPPAPTAGKYPEFGPPAETAAPAAWLSPVGATGALVAPPPPVAPAAAPVPPPAAMAAPPALTASVARDASGMPWDSRIHAATKAKTADGNWRARRNLDATLKSAVEAELRATMALPVPAPAPHVVPPALVTPVVSEVPPAPVVPAAPPPPEASAGETFPQFMSWVSGELAAGRIKQESLVAAHKALGLPNLLALNARPDLISAMRSTLSS